MAGSGKSPGRAPPRSRSLSARRLRKRSSQELVALLSHKNEWYVRQARQILGERRDQSILPELRQLIFAAPTPQVALAALWSHYVSGGLDEPLADRLLGHPAEYVRAWTIRLLGDEMQVPDSLAPRLAALATSDPSPIVRCQLAATARRLPGSQALPIAAALLRHGEDKDDPFLPLMDWWVLENKAISDRESVLSLVTAADNRELPLVRGEIAPRLARRYTAEHTDLGFDCCARLLDAAPAPADADALVTAMDLELAGQSVANIPAPLRQSLEHLLQRDRSPAALVRLGLRFGHPRAYARAMAIVNDSAAPEAERLQLIQTLGETKSGAAASDLVHLLSENPPTKIGAAILSALERSDHGDIPGQDSPALPAAQRAADGTGLRTCWPVARPGALALVEAIDQQILPRSTVSLAQLRRIQLHADPTIDALLKKNWARSARSRMPRCRSASRL